MSDDDKADRFDLIGFDSRAVWHYTDQTGLVGIIEGNHLWATSRDGLNDPQELTYALRELGQQWDHYKASTNLDPAVPIDQVDQLIKQVFDHIGSRSYFITSATTNGDLLEHWKGYGSNGYAICFDRRIGWDVRGTSETERAPDPYPFQFWRQVEYTRFIPNWSRVLGSPSGRALEEIITCAYSLTTRKLSAETALERAINSTESNICFQKHPGYENEDEVRVVVVNPPASVRHARNTAYTGGQVQYVELEPRRFGDNADRRLPIRGVRVGPRNSQTQLDEDLGSTMQLLQANDYHVPVIASPTPFLYP